MQIEQ